MTRLVRTRTAAGRRSARLGCLATALSAVTALAACGGGGAGSADSLNLTAWTTVTVPAQTNMIKKHLEQCAATVGATVRVETVTNDQLYTRFATLANSPPPNLLSMIDTPVAFMQSRGGLVELDDVVDAHGRDDFVPAHLHTVSAKGKIWAVPDAALHSALWYRKDLFKQAGLQPPRNWQELTTAAHKLTGNGRYGFAVPLGTAPFQVAADTLFQFFYTAGVTIFDPQTGAYVFDKQRADAVRSMAAMVELYKTASPPAAIDWGLADYRNAFAEGQVAMVSDAGGVVLQTQQQNPKLAANLGVVPFPGPDGAAKAHYAGAYNFAVGKTGPKQVEASKKILSCMLKPELVGERATTRPVFLQPSTKSANAATVYQSNEATKKYAEFNKVLQEQVIKEPGYRYGLEGGLNPAAGQFEKATFIPEATQKAVRGQWSPEQAVDFMDKQIRQLLEKN